MTYDYVECGICDVSFINETSLREHRELEHTYPHLGKEYTGKTRKEAPNMKKDAIKPTHDDMDCGICEVSFINENSLREHRELKHTYNCYGCRTKFYSEQKWKCHNDEEHLFSCDECNLHFIEEHDWRKHLVEGYRKEPWKLVDQEIPCPKCSQKFIS